MIVVKYYRLFGVQILGQILKKNHFISKNYRNT